MQISVKDTIKHNRPFYGLYKPASKTHKPLMDKRELAPDNYALAYNEYSVAHGEHSVAHSEKKPAMICYESAMLEPSVPITEN